MRRRQEKKNKNILHLSLNFAGRNLINNNTQDVYPSPATPSRRHKIRTRH